MFSQKISSCIRILGSVARSKRPVLCLSVAKPVWQRRPSIFTSPSKPSYCQLLHTSRPVRIATTVNLDPNTVHVAHTFLEQAIHVHWIQKLIGIIHSWGLPWYQAIAATTVLFRTVFLPLNVDLLRNSSRLNSIRKELATKEEALEKATSDSEKFKIATEVQDLFKEHKCSPYKNIITPFLMIPVFVSIFFAVEGLSYLHPEMTTGGTLWFTDLSKPDPSYFLPIVSAVTWLATIELGGDIPRTERMKWFRNALAYVSLALIPVTFPIPAGIFVYWISSNLFSLAQILILRNTKLRRKLGFPLQQIEEKEKQNIQSNDKLGLTV